MNNESTHRVCEGIPEEVFRKACGRRTNGMYARGKDAAMKALRIGRGHTVVETFKHDRQLISSYGLGARAVNKKYGGPLRIMQRKNGDEVNMYIVYKSDLDPI